MTTKAKNKAIKTDLKCPDCEGKLKLVGDMNTDWYGNLKYYQCKGECKERFVSQNGGELELAARNH